MRRYPISKLINWGWLVPQHTFHFPEEFFSAWETYPYGDDEEHSSKYRNYHILWDSEWFVDAENEPCWFLHPFFREGDEVGRLLRSAPLAEAGEDAIVHASGRTIVPRADYFFHWQAYALVDVISFADCNVSLLATPEVEEQAKWIAKLPDRLKDRDPTEVLRMPRRWGGHSEPMTWLSHYRALKESFNFSNFHGKGEREMRRRGARLLAAHLRITEEKLEAAIRDKLLVLANQWHWGNDFSSKLTEAAWPELQKDILFAVEWLCILNGRTIDFYLDKWRHQHPGGGEWRELRKVLPFEWFAAREDFIKLAPEYLKTYNETFPANRAYTEHSLKDLVDRLRSTNYPFGNLLRAFRELHEAITYRSDDFNKVDLRDRGPLDYYLLLAIRVESVLRYALESEGTLSSLADSDLGLSGYIMCRAKKLGVSAAALECFQKAEKRYTRLKDTPPEPIIEIMRMQSQLSKEEHYLVQAFLCCVLARNYFAHHYYLDGALT